MEKKNIEVEGGELLIQSKEGHYAVIPAKHRQEVMDMVKDGCDDCINNYIQTLPKDSDYAEDGSLYPEEPVINPNNPIQLEEVTVTAEAPVWLKYKQAWEKENPFDLNKYVDDRFNNPVGREAIKRINEEGWRKQLKQEGLRKRQTELDEATKMGLLYQRFNPQGKDDIAIADEQFKKRYGTSPHRYRYDNDLEYRKYYEQLTKEAISKIDYPSTDLRRKDAVAPNNMWMYPNLTEESKAQATNFSNEVIATALPIPGLETMGKIPSVFKAVKAGKNLIKSADVVKDATKVVDKVLSKTDNAVKQANNIKTSVNQLEELPLEVVFDDMLPNRSSTINLNRGDNYIKTKKQVPYEKIDLGNDLTLYNNASRQIDDESILGTNRAIKSIKNEKTNEYIDLKSWKDGDKIYYYFSANMPSSKIKAGKAYIELEKHIPIGSEILENSSLSMDSFNNILKQLKNPKFESSVKGKITLNNMSVNNKVPFGEKQSMFADAGKVTFDNLNDANLSVNEINKILKTHSLPEASVVSSSIKFQPQAHLPYQTKTVYNIELPNISLKKLYTILGITGGVEAIKSQNNKTE